MSYYPASNEVVVGTSAPSDTTVELWVDTTAAANLEGWEDFDARYALKSEGARVGFVEMFGGSTAPEGWAVCDGSLHGSAALLAVLGSPFTPDLRDRFTGESVIFIIKK